MNVVVTLAPDAPKNPEVGDLLKLQVFADEKLGAPGDGWQLVAPTEAAWLPVGSLTVSVNSVRVLPTDGNATKLELEAMVHQPGPLQVGAFQLQDQVTKAVVDVPPTTLTGVEAKTLAPPQGEPQWLLAPVRFGGWNWVLLGVVIALVVAALAVAGRLLWRRLHSEMVRKLTNSERALHAIANLQKYARAEKLALNEWKKFSFELAGILRKYSDENFGIDSRDMTDREFLYELKGIERAAPHLPTLEGILATITEVRYGRKELDGSVVPGLLLDARKFVESTAPAAEGASA